MGVSLFARLSICKLFTFSPYLFTCRSFMHFSLICSVVFGIGCKPIISRKLKSVDSNDRSLQLISWVLSRYVAYVSYNIFSYSQKKKFFHRWSIFNLICQINEWTLFPGWECVSCSRCPFNMGSNVTPWASKTNFLVAKVATGLIIYNKFYTCEDETTPLVMNLYVCLKYTFHLKWLNTLLMQILFWKISFIF